MAFKMLLKGESLNKSVAGLNVLACFKALLHFMKYNFIYLIIYFLLSKVSEIRGLLLLLHHLTRAKLSKQWINKTK